MTLERAITILSQWQVWTKGNWVGLAHAVDGDTPTSEEWSEIALAIAVLTCQAGLPSATHCPGCGVESVVDDCPGIALSQPASPPEAPTPGAHSLLCRWTYDGVPHCALDCPLRQESP